MVPYAPGGASDIIARPWAEALSQAFGQQFVVENRGGAGGMIGSEAVMKARARRLHVPADAVRGADDPAAAAEDALRSAKEFRRRSAASATRSPGFVIHPSVGVKTFQEMVDYAKANPGKLSYGSAGNGTITHFRLEMLKYKAGIDILHVPYRGSADSLNDLLANNIQMMAEINPLPHVKAGKLILLSINHPKRSPEFPDTPTLTECGYPEFGHDQLVRDLGAGRYAGGHHPEIQRQDRRDRQRRRHEEEAADRSARSKSSTRRRKRASSSPKKCSATPN